MIQTSNIVVFKILFDKFGLCEVGMHHFSTLDEVDSHLHVVDRSICDQIKM